MNRSGIVCHGWNALWDTGVTSHLHIALPNMSVLLGGLCLSLSTYLVKSNTTVFLLCFSSPLPTQEVSLHNISLSYLGSMFHHQFSQS
jgi:hypothetical protein